jgi:hypothetical protein
MTFGIVLGVIAAIVALFLIVVAMRPAAFKIERKATMSAPPLTVFEQVNDFRNWRAWSPWEKLDPNLKRTYEGPSAGHGAVYAWAGNKKAGEGRMTIVGGRPGELVRIRLEFLKPFVATNTAEFTFVPQGEQTLVTWTMTGTNNFFLKAFALFMNMDKLIGGDFEKGLAGMKATAESAARREGVRA